MATGTGHENHWQPTLGLKETLQGWGLEAWKGSESSISMSPGWASPLAAALSMQKPAGWSLHGEQRGLWGEGVILPNAAYLPSSLGRLFP